MAGRAAGRPSSPYPLSQALVMPARASSLVVWALGTNGLCKPRAAGLGTRLVRQQPLSLSPRAPTGPHRLPLASFLSPAFQSEPPRSPWVALSGQGNSLGPRGFRTVAAAPSGRSRLTFLCLQPAELGWGGSPGQKRPSASAAGPQGLGLVLSLLCAPKIEFAVPSPHRVYVLLPGVCLALSRKVALRTSGPRKPGGGA